MLPVVVEKIRDVLLEVDILDQGAPRRSRRNAGTSSAEVHGYVPGHAYRLVSAALQHILQLVPDDAHESAPNARLRMA